MSNVSDWFFISVVSRVTKGSVLLRFAECPSFLLDIKNSDHEREGGADGEPVTWDAFCCVNKIAFLTRAVRWAHSIILEGNQTNFWEMAL